jgi:hypothetical protein
VDVEVGKVTGQVGLLVGNVVGHAGHAQQVIVGVLVGKVVGHVVGVETTTGGGQAPSLATATPLQVATHWLM